MFVSSLSRTFRVFDSNEPHTAPFPPPSDKLPRKAGSEIFGEGNFADKDVEGWLRRMCILRYFTRRVADPHRRLLFAEGISVVSQRELG